MTFFVIPRTTIIYLDVFKFGFWFVQVSLNLIFIKTRFLLTLYQIPFSSHPLPDRNFQRTVVILCDICNVRQWYCTLCPRRSNYYAGT